MPSSSRHRDETCASHMPVLMEFVARFRPRHVVELGCGYYSTKLFIDACERVTSIESDSDEWLANICGHFGDRPNWRPLRAQGLETVCAFLDEHACDADLIFVDGDIYRAEETNHALCLAETVIGHDTQGWWAQDGRTLLRDKYVIPRGVRQIDFTHFPVGYVAEAGCADRPWTTLFSRNSDVVAHFTHVETLLYERFTFPYVYDTCPNRACA